MAGGPKKLEQYKYFSIVAWTLVVCSSSLVLYLALDLRQTAHELQDTSMNLDHKMQQIDALFENQPHATSSQE